MSESESESVSELEKLMAENNVDFGRMDVDGAAPAGCSSGTVVCIRPTCVRTNVVVGVQ